MREDWDRDEPCGQYTVLYRQICRRWCTRISISSSSRITCGHRRVCRDRLLRFNFKLRWQCDGDATGFWRGLWLPPINLLHRLIAYRLVLNNGAITVDNRVRAASDHVAVQSIRAKQRKPNSVNNRRVYNSVFGPGLGYAVYKMPAKMLSLISRDDLISVAFLWVCVCVCVFYATTSWRNKFFSYM